MTLDLKSAQVAADLCGNSCQLILVSVYLFGLIQDFVGMQGKDIEILTIFIIIISNHKDFKKMGQQYTELSEKHIQFIASQKLYFVGTATANSKVNISPKGMDSLRVLDNKTIAWLNVTGSGNETAAHVQTHPRMTVMFAAFEGNPMILRIYGKARAIHHNDSEWSRLYALFPPIAGARQIFSVAIDMVQTSCGMAVPFFEYAGEREQLSDWAQKKGETGIKAYWEEKNQSSLDGIPTHILSKNS